MAPKRLHEAIDSNNGADTSLASNAENPTADEVILNRSTKKRNACDGHIESIELVDFMCHRHLLIKFNAHINFVIGNNGSGKSAILTALTVALGGRASSTQRANSVDALIREGAQTGKVKVKLFNGGDNPYQLEVYGEHILVERSFRRGGANTYSIQAANGRMIAGRREEINSICDHFGIQVDNPLAVLTQETAKKFLSNAKPKELYEFFMKATQLEQLSIDYAFTMDRIRDSKARLEQSKSTLEPLRDSINRLEKQLADLERFKQAHQRIQRLRGELTWAMIYQREKELDRIKQSINIKTTKLTEIEEKINDDRENLRKLVDNINMIEASIAIDHDKLNAMLSQRTVSSNELKRHEQAIAELKMDAQNINTEFGSLRNQLEELNRKITEEMGKKSDNEQEKLRLKLVDLENDILGLNGQIVDQRSAESACNSKVEQLQAQLNLIANKKREVGRQIEVHKNSLQIAERCKGDRVRIYGERMGEALTEIRRSASIFSRPPVGPAGLHINLKDNRWTLAIEAILHSNIEAFIVNDHRDRKNLQNLLQNYALNNPIVVVRFDGELDISSGVPESSLLTALKVLDIDNAVVRKMLIIMSQIESNVLIEDRHEAMQVIRQRPKNVMAVFTCVARINAGLKTVSVTQLFTNLQRPRLIEDSTTRIKELEGKLANLSRQLGVMESDWSSIERELRASQLETESIASIIVNLERRLRTIKTEIRQIQEELYEKDSNVSYPIFEQEKQEIEDRMSSLGAQFQANNVQQQDLQRSKEFSTNKLAEIDHEITELRDSNTRSIEDISNSVKMRKSIERELENSSKQKLSEQNSLSNDECELPKMEKELIEMREAAGKVCARIETTRDIRDLDRELSAQEECLRLNDQATVDPVQVREDLESRRTQYREAEKSIVINEKLSRALSESLEQRQRAWIEFRKSVSKMSSTEFIFMLNARGFQGSLDYRHHDAELNIRVIPHGQQQLQTPQQQNLGKKRKKDQISVSDELVSENRDVRQLSGGEKSYSTACFLFSLWQAMGSPIRCLDEFDVYMDPINRSFVLELLVGHARASRVQFILITPNTIPDSYKTAPDVAIYRLRDPERGQTIISSSKKTVSRGIGLKNWNQKLRERRELALEKTKKCELLEARKAKIEDQKRRQELNRARKEENSRKAEVAQIISNPKKLKKMTKKQRKNLKIK